MKYILEIIVGCDTGNIYIDSEDENTPDTLIFTGRKWQAKEELERLKGEL